MKYKFQATEMLWETYLELLPHITSTGGLAKLLWNSVAGTIEPLLYSLDASPIARRILEERILVAAKRITEERERKDASDKPQV